MTKAAGIKGSAVVAGATDWSRVRETVLMMELAVGQIEAAMRDSDSSVKVLTDTFTTMAEDMHHITEVARDLPEDERLSGARKALISSTSNLAAMVSQAIIAFQFYDRLVQRLSHVSHSLESLAQLVSDEQGVVDPARWAELQAQIRSRYSMPEEIEMFEAVLIHGMSVHQALQNFMERMKHRVDDIELF